MIDKDSLWRGSNVQKKGIVRQDNFRGNFSTREKENDMCGMGDAPILIPNLVMEAGTLVQRQLRYGLL